MSYVDLKANITHFKDVRARLDRFSLKIDPDDLSSQPDYACLIFLFLANPALINYPAQMKFYQS